MDPHLVVYEGV